MMFGFEIAGAGYLTAMIGVSVGTMVLDVICKICDKPELAKLIEKAAIVFCMGLLFKFFTFDVLQEIMRAFLDNKAPPLHQWLYGDGKW